LRSVYPVGCATTPLAPAASPAGHGAIGGIGTDVPDYELIPILLVLMTIALTALIYWGGFVEERRNRRT
jgi:uncharacterized RDD family membrane protein YckC